jgi:hypothetical protein
MYTSQSLIAHSSFVGHTSSLTIVERKFSFSSASFATIASRKTTNQEDEERHPVPGRGDTAPGHVLFGSVFQQPDASRPQSHAHTRRYEAPSFLICIAMENQYISLFKGYMLINQHLFGQASTTRRK